MRVVDLDKEKSKGTRSAAMWCNRQDGYVRAMGYSVIRCVGHLIGLFSNRAPYCDKSGGEVAKWELETAMLCLLIYSESIQTQKWAAFRS